jgi:hypothetical protein
MQWPHWLEESWRGSPSFSFPRRLRLIYRRGSGSDSEDCRQPQFGVMEFQYDIAFSFTKEDEGAATQINDLLQDRYRTFLYSKAQEKLAGTDGEETFSAVFKEQARSVAVLLHPEWGSTPWTRIEQTAIRNRGFDEGYDFATFIVTEPGTPVPRWLPKARIWYDLQRFGLDGAAAVLAARIQERGGDAVQETLAARTARLERAQKFSGERKAFADSHEGVNASRAAHRRLVADIKASSDMLGSVGCRVQDVQYDNITMVVGSGVVLTVRYEQRYVNTLDGVALTAKFYDGVPRLPNLMVWEDPRTLESWKFTFQLVGPGRTAWVGPDGKEHSQETLADFLLKHFLKVQQHELDLRR